MRDLTRLIRELPLSVKIILLCAMARSVSFFALLAYLPIYLHDTLRLSGATVGYVVGMCLIAGTVVSVYGGYLADRFTKVNFMIGLDTFLTVLYLTLPAFKSAAVVVIFLLAANTASSSMSVSANAQLSELVRPEVRTKVFSLRYSLQNIGAAVGPFLGALAVRSDPGGPFYLAAGVIFLALVPVAAFRKRIIRESVPAGKGKESPGFAEVLKTMRADRRLALFTVGGILSIMVYGPLLTYMSQYFVVVESPAAAYKLVAYISAANAVVVIALQYHIGSKLSSSSLMKWLTVGIAAFAVGLVGLSLSTQVFVIVAAIAVFTVGEIIVVPAEYMFIDEIAPAHLRGSYFGAQNLIHIGVALGPIMCGILLDVAAPAAIFYALIAVLGASWWFYILGYRAASRDPVPVPANA